MSVRFRGFSLIELLLALAIGLVLVAGGSRWTRKSTGELELLIPW